MANKRSSIQQTNENQEETAVDNIASLPKKNSNDLDFDLIPEHVTQTAQITVPANATTIAPATSANALPVDSNHPIQAVSDANIISVEPVRTENNQTIPKEDKRVATNFHPARVTNVLGAAWQHSQDHKPLPRRWLVAAAAFAAVVVAVFAGQWFLATYFSPEDHPLTVPEFDGELMKKTSQKQTWLEDALKAQKEANLWENKQANRNHPPQASGSAMPHSTSRNRTKQNKKAQTAPPLVTVDAIAQSYETLFGPAEDYHAGSTRASKSQNTKSSSDKAKGASKGTLLHAVLQDQVVSSPMNEPVIAVMTREGQLGSVTLPPGTQLHGNVKGGGYDDARILVGFGFALLKDGTIIDFIGSARDERGRPGIPGTRPLTAKSAGSVGISAATRMISHAGQSIPGVGGLVAAGIEGAADSASDKARRIDRDEVVVIAEPHTPLAVYVQAINNGEKN